VNFRTRLTLLTCAAITGTLIVASFVAYSLARAEAYGQVDTNLEDRVILTRAFADAEERQADVDPSFDAQRRRGGLRIPGTGPGAPGGFTRTLDDEGDEVRPEPPPLQQSQAGTQSQGAQGAQGAQGTQPPQLRGPRIHPEDLPERVRNQFQQIDVELPITDEARAAARGSSRRLLHETVEVDGAKYRIVTGRVNDDYSIQVARPLGETNRFLSRMAMLLALVTVGGIAIGVAAALLVTGAASAPVARLTELTARVRESGDLSQRVEVTSSDDLGRLAHSVNSMLEELERSAERQQQLVDDASHQLRTPLASIRTNVDVLQRTSDLDSAIAGEIMADLSAQTDELTGLVRDLVDLASTVESDVVREPVDLDAVADEAVRRVRGAFEDVSFETDLAPSVVEGSEERLVRMVQNLLHNAGKWSPAGGTVLVRVRGSELTVTDHGPGVADDEKQRVFERFHRAADSRDVPGSGLGLAIVQQVVSDHGGTVRVSDTPGGGATFTVRLPLARP
jgi:two-component system sensor histidine kinase MprB